jgi:hypothetical protein
MLTLWIWPRTLVGLVLSLTVVPVVHLGVWGLLDMALHRDRGSFASPRRTAHTDPRLLRVPHHLLPRGFLLAEILLLLCFALCG